jgi:uncharacterized protein
MLVGVISDTHNQLDRTRRAVNRLLDAGAEVLIHCGDFTRPDVLAVCAVRPLYFVFGNNDDPAALQQAAVELDGVTCLGWGGEVTLVGQRIAVTHGHLPHEARRLLALQPDYLLFGHTHVAADHPLTSGRQINPGALHRAAEYSVAVLDLYADAVRFVPIPR